MRKSLAIGLALLLVFAFAGMALAQDSDSVNIDMSLYVDEYIETTNNFSHHVGTLENVGSLGMYEGSKWLKYKDLAYANCPFNITVAGNNPAETGNPRFAREEVDENGNGLGSYDILRTSYGFRIKVNGETADVGSPVNGADDFPITLNHNEAPHDGQIMLRKMRVAVNKEGNDDADESYPLREAAIDPNYNNIDSPDAGTYKADLTVTISAL